LTRNLGQVAIATFSNDQGLIAQGNNDYAPGPNSGTPVISTPGSGKAGTIVAGALELSNVDLSSQFVDLISASTGFSSASKVITTSDQMLQSLLQAVQ
jgi:flagellar hook protein FlgE